MKLYVDLATLQLIEGPGLRTPIPAVRFKRGDAANLEVVFLTNGQTAATIGNPATLELKFGVKARGRYDLGYLVHEDTWTMPAPAPATPIYGCSPSFNTDELNAALGVGSATGAELSEITLMGEITWREGSGPPTSTRTFQVVVENDVNRGTEGVPTEANPAYPPPASIALLSQVVRHDAAQALTNGQKTQARSNLGLGSAAQLPMESFASAGQSPIRIASYDGYSTFGFSGSPGVVASSGMSGYYYAFAMEAGGVSGLDFQGSGSDNISIYADAFRCYNISFIYISGYASVGLYFNGVFNNLTTIDINDGSSPLDSYHLDQILDNVRNGTNANNGTFDASGCMNNRTASSNAAYAALIARGWTLLFNGPPP